MVETPTGQPPAATTGAPGRRGLDYKWIAASVVMVGALMSIINQTVINVALPTLEVDFGVSLTDIQWVVTGYSLGLAGVIPLSGWLSDRYGTKRVFMVTQVLFTLASLLCGLAWSSGSLIAFRVVQGLAGGLVMPTGMTILMSVSRPEERGRMMAMLGLPMMIGPVIGPTLGGWLVESVSWRWIFFISAPFGITGALLSALLLRGGGQGRRHPLDLIGLLLVTPAVVGVTFGLSQPSAHGWFSVPTLLPLLGGLALLAAFCLFELRQKAPLIEIRVFRDAAFSASMALNFLVGVALFGGVLLVPLFLQQVQGYSAFDSGLVLGAQGVGAALTMPLGGWLTDRLGARRVVPFGIVALTVGTALLATLTPSTPRLSVAGMLILRGMGIGLAMMPSFSAAYVTLPPHLISRATSISNVVQRVAGALGVAIVATILAERITANLPRLPGGSLPAGGNLAFGNLAAAPLPPGLKSLLLQQVARGFDETFWIATGIGVLGLPLTLLLRRALRPEQVRAFALSELGQGVVLGAAARRVRDRGLNGASGRIAPEEAFRTLAAAAIRRLDRGLTLLRAGTNAAGLVPQPRLSLGRRVSFAVVLCLTLAAATAAVMHGYQTPSVPSAPVPAAAAAAAGQR
jgi:EmrB/QacA subfamily drug resistance transporter